jgi:hypothetical protein
MKTITVKKESIDSFLSDYSVKDTSRKSCSGEKELEKTLYIKKGSIDVGTKVVFELNHIHYRLGFPITETITYDCTEYDDVCSKLEAIDCKSEVKK